MKTHLFFLLNLLILNGSVDALDKMALTKSLKNDIYAIFVHEMAIISKNFTLMAQDNPELEKDLANLYSSFLVSQATAQEKLDTFCTKWNLGEINIANLQAEEVKIVRSMLPIKK